MCYNNSMIKKLLLITFLIFSVAAPAPANNNNSSDYILSAVRMVNPDKDFNNVKRIVVYDSHEAVMKDFSYMWMKYPNAKEIYAVKFPFIFKYNDYKTYLENCGPGETGFCKNAQTGFLVKGNFIYKHDIADKLTGYPDFEFVTSAFKMYDTSCTTEFDTKYNHQNRQNNRIPIADVSTEYGYTYLYIYTNKVNKWGLPEKYKAAAYINNWPYIFEYKDINTCFKTSRGKLPEYHPNADRIYIIDNQI